jgi:hypothetical protein
MGRWADLSFQLLGPARFFWQKLLGESTVTPIYPNVGTEWIAQLFRAAMAGCVAHLFKNSYVVEPPTTLSNFLEADYSGYAPITVTSLLPPYLDPSGGSTTRIPTEQFDFYAPKSVDSVTIGAGGAGYTSVPTVTFSGGGGFGATGHATTAANAVTAVIVDSPGVGYTSAPTVVFGGPGTGATGTAVLTDHGQGIAAVNLTSGGAAYTTPPAVSFSGGGGSGAVAIATLVGGVVTAVTVLNAGSGWTSAPTVVFTGGGGAGAAATAVLGHVGNSVWGFYVLDPSGALVLAATFDSALPMSVPGQSIPLDVLFRFPN